MTSNVSSSEPAPACGPAETARGLLLILSCAEERLQICLAQDGRLLAHQDWVVPGRAMRHLAPALDQALAAFDLRVPDLSGIACVRGPGGFTGLRLCLATAYGLAFGAALPMAGLDYLPLLASGPASLLHGRLAVLTHARQGLVYAQLFMVPGPKSLCAPQVMSVDNPALLDNTKDNTKDTPLFVLGSGVRRNLEQLSRQAPKAYILDQAFDHPRPEHLIRAALAAPFSQDSVIPLYLRPSDAEENLEALAAKRGLNPHEARQHLIASLEELP